MVFMDVTVVALAKSLNNPLSYYDKRYPEHS